MTPWLAFIESNTSGTGRMFALAAMQSGFKPILITANPSRYKYADEMGIEVLETNTQDETTLVTACRRLASGAGLAGITTSSEYFVGAVAAVAHSLKLPGPNPRAVRSCRDKHKQMMRLKAGGCSVPKFGSVTTAKAAVSKARAIGFPVVVKPVSGSGSVGVKLCVNSDEVATHAKLLLRQRQNERGLPISRRILIQSSVIGPEYSVETFCKTIIGITQKHLGPLPYFVETGHDYPAEIPAVIQRRIHGLVLSALDTLGLDWGPAHIEIRLVENKPKIIEVNPRLAGGYIPQLVWLASRIDLISATIDLVTGRPPNLKKTFHRYASIRFIVPEEDGMLTAVGGLDAARHTPLVVETTLYSEPGAQIVRHRDFRDRIGHVIATGDTSSAASSAAEIARSSISLFMQADNKRSEQGPVAKHATKETLARMF